MNKNNFLWFGVYGKAYEGDEPAFFDDSVLPWAETLKENYPAIRAALEPLMQDDSTDLQPYFDEVLQYPPKNWKTIGFYFWGKADRKNLARFPEVARLLQQIPGLLTASFNMLEPNSRIKPHWGETNATWRVHLGIKIPAGLPDCGFKVKDEVRAWQEGELLVFLDANWHEAFNLTGERRYVLLLEVMRPEFAHLEKAVCVQALAMLSLYWVLAHIPFLSVEKLHAKVKAGGVPKLFVDVILLPFKLIWSTALIFLSR